MHCRETISAHWDELITELLDREAANYKRDDGIKFAERALGVRLWLADVAARISLQRSGSGAAPGGSWRALRLFHRASRHPCRAGTCARSRSRRRLSRLCVPGH